MTEADFIDYLNNYDGNDGVMLQVKEIFEQSKNSKNFATIGYIKESTYGFLVYIYHTSNNIWSHPDSQTSKVVLVNSIEYSQYKRDRLINEIINEIL